MVKIKIMTLKIKRIKKINKILKIILNNDYNQLFL
jgi:hypothetical protein